MFKLISDYFFESRNRYWAILYLFGALFCIASSIALMCFLSTWFTGFMAAFTAMSSPLFMTSLQILLAITIGFVVVNTVKETVVGLLAKDWRDWLTEKLCKQYTSPENESNYLELERQDSIDNPAQRIQQDVQTFTEQTLKLGLGLIEAVLTCSVFIGNLWIIGGAATFGILGASITIPGYLVWVALLFAVVTTLITHFIGKALTTLSNERQTLEANFRQDIDTLANNAESVAQDHGEDYFQQSILSKFQLVCKNIYETIKIRVGLTAFTSFYQQISLVLPYLAAAPLYFAKKTTFGQLVEIGMSFGQILYSLSWFNTSYPELATYTATAARVVELENAMTPESTTTQAPPTIIVHTNAEAETLTVQNLNLSPPLSTNYMIRELTLTFRPGEHTLIKGKSGLGKSTLFKAMANVWKYGEGEITVSSPEKMCLLPQRPVIHDNTLKAILAYPNSANEYTDEACLAVLHAVGGMEKHTPDLNKNAPWSRTLSLGEQQRISFARALLKKPTWLLLDEATSAIDEPSEEHLYNLIRRELDQTTFISIAHRSTVDKHHDRIVNLDVDEQSKAVVRDTFFAHPTLSAVAANDDDETPALHIQHQH